MLAESAIGEATARRCPKLQLKVDAGTAGVIMSTLLAAHDLADHVVQTDAQASGKTTAWRAMMGHVGGYQAVQLVSVLVASRAIGVRLSWRGVLAGSLFSAASHTFIDRRWPVREILCRTGSAGFAEMQIPVCGMYQADQALHHACLWLSAIMMTTRR